VIAWIAVGDMWLKGLLLLFPLSKDNMRHLIEVAAVVLVQGFQSLAENYQ
jgi:hypothetical protein